MKKNILVFNTACFGDVLLCNSLCQNIKAIFPDANLVFVVDKPFYEVAKYQKDVDDVIVYDKNGVNKGSFGFIKFIKDFKYKNIFASFVTYGSYRNILIAKILGSKNVITPVKIDKEIKVQKQHSLMMKKFMPENDIVDYPIRYFAPEMNFDEFANKYNIHSKYVIINPASKRKEKDMSEDTVFQFINYINKYTDFQVALTGLEKDLLPLVNKLDSLGVNYINLVGRTNLIELSNVINHSEALISVDTGTMHLGLSLGIPVVTVFYENDKIAKWAPDASLYDCRVVSGDISPQNIFNTFIQLKKEHHE